MSQIYKTTGINLKSMPLGDSDRLLTVLTRDLGLMRLVAPGARKHNSGLSGRSGLFVVNHLLVAKGRSLDKITQAETLESYPGLSQDLGKLAAGQYLAEIVLAQALSEQPQEELFCLLNEHLGRLERLPKTKSYLLLPCLTHAVFHLLALAGITPQVQVCCLTQLPLLPDFKDPNWRVGFSVPAGGTVSLPALERLQADEGKRMRVAETGTSYQTVVHRQEIPILNIRLNATELSLLQQLAVAELPEPDTLFSSATSHNDWQSIEQILRQYAQYHFGRPIRSAALIDSYASTLPSSREP